MDINPKASLDSWWLFIEDDDEDGDDGLSVNLDVDANVVYLGVLVDGTTDDTPVVDVGVESIT